MELKPPVLSPGQGPKQGPKQGQGAGQAQPPPAGRQRPAPPPFSLGDRMPNFCFPDAKGDIRDFHAEVTGKPALLLLAERLSEGPGAALLAGLREKAARFAELGAEIFLLGGEPPPQLAQLSLPAGPTCLALQDPDQRMTRVLTGGMGARLFVLDANQRVLAAPDQADPLAQLALAESTLAAWRAGFGERRLARGPAPVIFLPDVLPLDLCDRLVALWEGENREGQVSAGKSDNFYSPDRKRNREHDVRDPALVGLIATYISRRIGPELAKAFVYTQPYRLESFIVLGYTDERQDFFGRHRDRYLPEHARRFAMSLNLNDGYEGGELTFPEYSNDLYKPPKGGACVFSCSLLHEALPVTRGRRFAMTTFFLGVDQPQQQGQKPQGGGQAPPPR